MIDLIERIAVVRGSPRLDGMKISQEMLESFAIAILCEALDVLYDKHLRVLPGYVIENIVDYLASTLRVGKSLLFASRTEWLTWRSSNIKINGRCL